MANCFLVTGHFDPKMILKTKRSKAPHIHVQLPSPSPKFHCTTSHSMIAAIFHFPIGHDLKFNFFFKKIEISKSQQVHITFVITVTGNIQKSWVEKREEEEYVAVP